MFGEADVSLKTFPDSIINSFHIISTEAEKKEPSTSTGRARVPELSGSSW